MTVTPAANQYGTSLITVTVTDGNGGSASEPFLVTVYPKVPPVCCDGKEWRLTGATGPSARSGHAMVYDAVRRQVVLFGGDDGTLQGDTWLWNGTNWTRANVSMPTARRLAAMAFDRGRGRAVLFGGSGPGGVLDDTWEWDGANWQRMTIAGPGPRDSHGMAYDAIRGRIVLFGGRSSTGSALGDTWEYDGNGWTQVAATHSPGSRAGHAMAWDGQRVLVFGGAAQEVDLGDTWTFMGSNWQQVATAGPSPRRYAALAYDDACQRAVLFGGATSPTNLALGTWEWDQTGWTPKTDVAPARRYAAAMAHDSARRQTVMFGGSLGPLTRADDTWTRDLDRTPPRIVTVDAACTVSSLCVTFSEEIDPASALDPARYLVTPGGVVMSVHPGPDLRAVCLELGTLLLPGQAYRLTVISLRDSCGNSGNTEKNFTCGPCLRGSAGAEFWIAFPGNDAPEGCGDLELQLFISGAHGVSGTVEVPGLVPPFLAVFSIPAFGHPLAVVPLPREVDLGRTNDVVARKGVHVLANDRVTVYGHSHLPCSTDTYLALPVHSLGTTYYVLTYQDVFTTVPQLHGVQFVIVGTHKDTLVKITPSAEVHGHPAGVSFEVILQQGETYQLISTTPADLHRHPDRCHETCRGLRQPSLRQHPQPRCLFCDHLVEQLLPADLWGTEFLTLPLAMRLHGDTFRLLALEDHTFVTINGTPAPILRAGQFHQQFLDEPAHILADKPILVAQYAHSSDFDRNTNSDPFMVQVPPTGLYTSNYAVHVPASGFDFSFLNVTIPKMSAGDLMLDEFPVPLWLFQDIGLSGYVGARLYVAPGSHEIDTANGMPFGVTVYGWGPYDSYGYPQASGLSRIRMDKPCLCPTNFVTNCTSTAGTVVTYPPPALCYPGLRVHCEPPSGSLFAVGTTEVECAFHDAFGLVSECSFDVIVVCERLTIERLGADVLVWFPSGSTLLTATNLTGRLEDWRPVPNAISPYRAPLSGRQAFFRWRR